MKRWRENVAKEIHTLIGAPLQNKNPVLGTKIFKAIIDAIVAALHREETVRVQGFGTFRVITKTFPPAPRLILTSDGYGRPRDCAPGPIYHKSKKYVVFTPAGSLMAMINLPTATHGPNYKERRTQRRWDIPDAH